ncbi:MAG TPA: undecaprenyl-phosphate glucose phosphotransferase [Thermodesulfobacteriota bacterium]|nr:undecaprenyl-phosphate glucose phosphotransferase [Deltaproteobacteria bacterium]HNR13063.1 undecaprenyl-phosphate glucose phosphotransferase [Thermodesulfobacteriota bacterium]HNU70506.1 undecaprenyl-phosphate glucose phosphotransferase [Thermodesulfobacteriota bacterium]
MVKRHSQVFLTMLFVGDMVIVAGSWLAAYYLRFYVDFIPIYKEIPPFRIYFSVTFYAALIWAITFRAFGLYSPMRTVSKLVESTRIVKASLVAFLVFMAVVFYLREYKYSRGVLIYFWIVSTVGLVFARGTMRTILRFFRRKGYNLRFILIIGAGELGRRLLRSIKAHPELGMRVVGFLTRHQKKLRTRIDGVPVLGVYEDVQNIIRSQPIDQVFLALPLEEHARLREVMRRIDNEIVDVKIIPDIFEYMTLGAGIAELDNMPIISLRDSPLYGWNRILKRVFDVVLSLLLLILLSPLMAGIACLIKLTSPGPIFFRQERMGLDGKLFTMLKFRTMVEHAEKETGPVWASANDGRRTWIGAFLRKTSLDELPQFFNVLKGNMSIVGPRPERAFFINQFKEIVPHYMLRHKIKAGITGWAQINGWRGNTSIEKRIEHDIYYIENWSLLFDVKIIVLTLWKGMLSKHAY